MTRASLSWYISVSICTHVTVFVAGKAGNKEGGPEEKKDDGELWCNVEAQAAFLGPNLWDKTLPYDADLKVRIYILIRVSYVFICGLFNDAVSSSDSAASNDRKINE
jgi:hypothetical protein